MLRPTPAMFPCRRAAALLAAFALAVAALAADIDAGRYLEDVKYLASDDLKGRGAGEKGLEKAADYIARQFRQAGFEAVGGSYFQPFRVTTNARLGKRNRMEFTLEGKRTQLKFREDFIPFNFSAAARVTAPVVFAGYGITAREYNYDDYQGLDVKGKLVLVLRHEPQEHDENSVFAGKMYTEHSQYASKASNARMHGAAGVMVVNDTAAHSGDDALERFARPAGPASAGFPFVQVRAVAAARWLAAAGKDLKELETAIDKDLKPRSVALPEMLEVTVEVDLKREQKIVRNVAGYLRGESDEYVVIGAHYDHIGLGEQYSLAPSEAGKPHPGADDNASGAAGLTELARYFGGRARPRRGVLLLAFAGEELGLLGSSYYVNQPLLPIEKAVAMLNMDMVGRVREGRVFIGGTGTGVNLKELIDAPAAASGLKLDFTDQVGYGASDHTSFTTKQVPVLFFFSGLHADYHKPGDTWDKIDAPETARLLRLVAGVTEKLQNAPGRPEFVRVKAPAARGQMGGGGGGGAWFGSVPDFTEIPNGLRFADITPGSPAAAAGLRGGDILFEFDGKPVGNLYDFTYALRARKPGETVTVKVRRGSGTVEARVTLVKRQ